MKKIRNTFILLAVVIVSIAMGYSSKDGSVDSNYLLESELENNESSMVTTYSTNYPIEIEEMLNATPFGSEIYLEEKSSGELYLRIEVMVPAPVENSNLDKNEIIENIPFEEIIVI